MKKVLFLFGLIFSMAMISNDALAQFPTYPDYSDKSDGFLIAKAKAAAKDYGCLDYNGPVGATIDRSNGGCPSVTIYTQCPSCDPALYLPAVIATVYFCAPADSFPYVICGGGSL